MLKQSDIDGRLKLFRYGLVAVTLISFLVAWIVPWFALQSALGGEAPGLMSHIGTALIVTVVVALVSVGAYFGYSAIIKRGGSAAAE